MVFAFKGNLNSPGENYQCTRIKRPDWNGKYCLLYTTDQNLMSTIASFYSKLYSELFKTPVPFTVKKKHRKNSFLNFILLKLTKIARRLCTRQMR